MFVVPSTNTSKCANLSAVQGKVSVKEPKETEEEGVITIESEEWTIQKL